ncbi:MAG: peptide ABC transporter permease, partial [Alphaproteobacteria bacterium]
LVHTSYQIFLAWAYEKGDLSRVYPIARGSAPLMVLVVGSVLLPDRLAPLEATGIVVLGAGILGMAAGVFRSGESIALLPLALATAVATATYSMVDGTGARVDGDALAYVGWLLALATVFYAPAAIWMRGTAVIPRGAKGWLWGMGAGAASWAAYATVVWAMTQAPIALVAALRETSILFAVLLGWLLFGDRMTRGKWLSAGLILLGVLLTRLAAV